MQIAGLRVRVADAPAVDEHLAHIGAVVAIRVFQENKTRRLRDDDAAAGKDERSREIQRVRENRELIRAPVAIRVLADLDVVMARASGRDAVRIVARLRHPQPSARIPGQGDGLANVRLAGEKLEPAIRRHLRPLHRALHHEWMLEGERLRALLVVGHVRIWLALLGFALREKFLPLRLRRRIERADDRLANLLRLAVLRHGQHAPFALQPRERWRVAAAAGHQRHIVTRRELFIQAGRHREVIEIDRLAPELLHELAMHTRLRLLHAEFIPIEDANGPRLRGADGGEEAEGEEKFHGRLGPDVGAPPRSAAKPGLMTL